MNHKQIHHRLLWLASCLSTALFLLTLTLSAAQAYTPTTTPLSPQAEQIITGTLNGANYRIRIPDGWDGETLVVYAHGYRAEDGSTAAEAAPGGDEGEAAFLAAGYAIAGSAYSQNGWAVEQGLTDTLALVNLFTQTITSPQRTILLGASMGSVVAFKSIELYPHVYDGAIPICGLGAGASRNWDAALAFALAYDVVFGWNPDWGTVDDVRDDINFFSDVFPEMATRPSAANNYKNLGHYEFIRLVLQITEEEFYDLFGWLNVNMSYATQARAELERRAGGSPVQNANHFYHLSAADKAYLSGLGVNADAWLSKMNQRTHYTADPAARAYLQANADYTGHITRPVLTLHTTGDGLVSVLNAPVYEALVTAAGQSDHFFQMYTDAVGHCTFTAEQISVTVQLMDNWIATGVKPTSADFDPALGFLPEFTPAAWPIAEKQVMWLPLITDVIE